MLEASDSRCIRWDFPLPDSCLEPSQDLSILLKLLRNGAFDMALYSPPHLITKAIAAVEGSMKKGSVLRWRTLLTL